MSSFESQEPNPSQNINSGNVSGNCNNIWDFSQSTNCGNVDNSHHNTYNEHINANGSYNNTVYNYINNHRVTDERRDILEWLSPLAPRLRHQDVKRSQVEGVGDWLLQTDEFKNWNTSEDGLVSPILFCYGDLGVGKTHIRYGLTFSWENGGD